MSTPLERCKYRSLRLCFGAPSRMHGGFQACFSPDCRRLGSVDGWPMAKLTAKYREIPTLQLPCSCGVMVSSWGL